MTSKERLIKSFVFLIAYAAVGFNESLMGVTLLDMRLMINASDSEASVIIPSQCFGFAMGGIIGKPLHAYNVTIY